MTDVHTSHTHTVEDTVYTIRGLTGEDEEIQRWCNFCANTFRYKTNPPPASYFYRHYVNDPLRQPNYIRVATTTSSKNNKNEEVIVSSCRIFCRNISISPGTVVLAGGIGEVCTAEQHRRRGLSKLLLENTISIMNNHQGMQVSLLHAAPTYFPVYQARGYQTTRSEWSLIKNLDMTKLTTTLSSTTTARTNQIIRKASFPQDTNRLQQMHEKFSQRRFAGCVVRSKEYWNNYLAKELEGTLFVLETTENDNCILGWMSIRQRGATTRFQVQEFGCHSTIQDEVEQVFVPLLQHCLDQQQAGVVDVQQVIDLHLPTFLVRDGKVATCAETIEEANDEGWMYLVLQKEGGFDMVKHLEATKQPLLLWPSDSF